MELVNVGINKPEVKSIPVGWSVETIESLVDKIIGGGTPSRSRKEFWGGKLPWATVKDFATFNRFYTQEYITKIGLQNSSSNLIPRGTLITSTRMALGKAVIYETDVCINQDLKAIFPNKKLNTDFFYYWFQFNSNKLEELGSGSTVMGISLLDLKKLEVILPKDIIEQKAIATALIETDEIIATIDKLISKKKAIKQGAMQQLLTPPDKGGKRLSGFKGEWKEFTIDELCKTFTKQTGFDYSNHIKPTLLNENRRGTLPFIQNKDFDGQWVNFDTDYFIPTDVAERFPRILLNEECLMISISGSIGKVGVFNNKQTAFIGGAVAVGKFKNPEYLNWVMYYLQSERGQALMLKDVKAGSHQNLILDDIRKMNIPMPEINEQKAIVEMLESMEIEILTLEEKKSKFKQIKQGMMQELLTGKTRLV